MSIKIKVIEIDHHRNGVVGVPFYVVKFTQDKANMLGIVFEEPGTVAVFDMDLLAQGCVVAFGQNSWRGDWYENPLREAIEQWENERSK